MSLSGAEQRRTSDELRQNLALCGLTAGEVGGDLGFAAERLESTLAVDAASDPVDVWQLRDYLERAVLDQGREPAPFTVLTESSRALARGWFRLRPAPRHVFAR